MRTSAQTPAATSSRTIPVPSGSFSNCRIGGGFIMSKARKSIKLIRKVFHAGGTPINAINWPATSSITTDCGSLLPSAREARVAAGMPTPAAKAATANAVPVRKLAGRERDRAAQSKTVAADPQVPGPGFSCPTPKKVAITFAQSGVAPRLAVLCCRPLVSMVKRETSPSSAVVVGHLPALPGRFPLKIGSRILTHGLPSRSSGLLSWMPSSASFTGDETT
jgi:hypothetical protein